MRLSKRAWDPFHFLPKQKEPPKGYSSPPETTKWKRSTNKDLPPHVPLSPVEFDVVETGLNAAYNIGKAYGGDQLEHQGEYYYFPIKNNVSAGKRLRKFQGFFRKLIHNLKSKKKRSAQERFALGDLQAALSVLIAVYDRLVAQSAPQSFQYDSSPQFSKPIAKIPAVEAKMLEDIAKKHHLQSPVETNEENIYVPQRIHYNNRDVRVNKHLQKFQRAMPDFTLLDSIHNRLRSHQNMSDLVLSLDEKDKLIKILDGVDEKTKSLLKNSDEDIYPAQIDDEGKVFAIRTYTANDYAILSEHVESPNYFKVLQDRLSAKAEPVQWKLIISAEPHDILTMSTNKGWSSCTEFGKCNYHTLDSAVSNYDMVAYAVSEKHNNWLARVWLRNDGYNRWWPETQVYGTTTLDDQDFLNQVNQYLLDKNILGKFGQYHPNASGWSDHLRSAIQKPKNSKPTDPKDPMDHLYEDDVPTGNVNFQATKLPKLYFITPLNLRKLYTEHEVKYRRPTGFVVESVHDIPPQLAEPVSYQGQATRIDIDYFSDLYSVESELNRLGIKHNKEYHDWQAFPSNQQMPQFRDLVKQYDIQYQSQGEIALFETKSGKQV